MKTNTREFQVEKNEKQYGVTVSPAHLNSATGSFVQIHRIKKNGMKGRILHCYHKVYWSVWNQCREKVLAQIDGANNCWK